MRSTLIFETHLILSSMPPPGKTAQEVWNNEINNPDSIVIFVDSRTGEEIFNDKIDIVYSQVEIFLMGIEYAGIISKEKYFIDYPNGAMIEVQW